MPKMAGAKSSPPDHPLGTTMKLVNYRRGDAARFGAVVGADIVDLVDLATAAGQSLPGDIITFIEQSPAALDRAKALIAAHEGKWPAGTTTPLAGATLLAPVPRPPKGVIGIGLNYVEHVAESNRAMQTQKELPTHPVTFIKPSTSIIGPEAAIVHNPKQTQQLDWEAELAVVIGTRCRNVAEADWRDHVFGYTCVNDISARDMRYGGQWGFSKGQDTFCPMGPWLVTADEIADPHDLKIGIKVNGVQKQDSNTSYMIFKTGALIEHITRGVTLEPGDVIATGTPAGVGISYDPPQFLKAGDEVVVEVEGIGTLRNTVVGA